MNKQNQLKRKLWKAKNESIGLKDYIKMKNQKESDLTEQRDKLVDALETASKTIDLIMYSVIKQFGKNGEIELKLMPIERMEDKKIGIEKGEGTYRLRIEKKED